MAHGITDACIGCTACANLCPVFAIEGVRGQKHTILAARCVDCGVCGRVCPKGAVCDDTGAACHAVPRAQWPVPRIDQRRCSACQMCLAACTAGALAISQPRFRGDIAAVAELRAPARCTGCGQCAIECPLGAITMQKKEGA